ncbi:hypothetical protein [Bacillus phage SDFMU_Pbc]|uniref:Uncharacterized protein n=1 Tax=Bacillus phage SDFMU_Pbc TaxID=3076135 RepID=A0AA96KS32_9CAUD|nr:hypothetical protein [Bacillus phage SDFMU_Pbc]
MSNSTLQKVYIGSRDFWRHIYNDTVNEYGVYCTDTRETENDVLIVVQAGDLIFEYLDGEAIWYTIKNGADVIAVDEPKDEEGE